MAKKQQRPVALKHMNVKVSEKLFVASRKKMKKNNHEWRDVIHAALAAYGKGELAVKAS